TSTHLHEQLPMKTTLFPYTTLFRSKKGQNFQIIRPRGDVKGVHKQKRGFLGTYVLEVGQLQVFKVRENTSAAQVTFSCEAAEVLDRKSTSELQSQSNLVCRLLLEKK